MCWSSRSGPVRNGLTKLTLSFDLPEDQVLPADTQIRMTIGSIDKKEPAEQIILTEENLKLFARTEIPISIGHKTLGRNYLLTLTVETFARKHTPLGPYGSSDQFRFDG